MRALLATLTFLAFATPSSAERLVSTVSRDRIAITSSFAGETLTLFGNIEPDVGATQKFVEGPFNIIITVSGPLQDRVARHGQSVSGIWMNTEQIVFRDIPSYYHVLSSGTLTEMMPAAALEQLNILPENLVRQSFTSDVQDSAILGRELIRLMTDGDDINVDPKGVVFRSSTLYTAQINLPSDVPPGPFLAHTYLVKAGVVVAERSDGFSVRKIGFERFLGFAAVQQPLLYGLATVILAMVTGWLGGAVFRR